MQTSMKTPIQELIKSLKTYERIYDSKGLIVAIDMAEKLLKEEKEHFEKCFNSARIKFKINDYGQSGFEDFKDYYNETYNQKK